MPCSSENDCLCVFLVAFHWAQKSVHNNAGPKLPAKHKTCEMDNKLFCSRFVVFQMKVAIRIFALSQKLMVSHVYGTGRTKDGTDRVSAKPCGNQIVPPFIRKKRRMLRIMSQRQKRPHSRRDKGKRKHECPNVRQQQIWTYAQNHHPPAPHNQIQKRATSARLGLLEEFSQCSIFSLSDFDRIQTNPPASPPSPGGH